MKVFAGTNLKSSLCICEIVAGAQVVKLISSSLYYPSTSSLYFCEFEVSSPLDHDQCILTSCKFCMEPEKIDASKEP